MVQQLLNTILQFFENKIEKHKHIGRASSPMFQNILTWNLFVFRISNDFLKLCTYIEWDGGDEEKKRRNRRR